MNEALYRSICQKYGQRASWAIWSSNGDGDPTIIDSHVEDLNTRRVFIALNVSWWFDYPSGYWAV
jgi:hypothetical protein